jgi:hypothetical protein
MRRKETTNLAGMPEIRVQFHAPAVNEYRNLTVWLVDADDAEAWGLAEGAWAYAWKGRDASGGYASAEAAEAAGVAEGAQRWPGLRPATGDEGAYASVNVIDESGR